MPAVNHKSMLTSLVVTAAICAGTALSAVADPKPAGRSLPPGLLDVTQSPYFADATGATDATDAIQRAVNAARDQGQVCFFPSGTYLISDTISCEQQVEKMARARITDNRTQHYWNLPQTIVLLGSTTGSRPVLKLSSEARGFDDPQHPEVAVHIWAQTRDDAPGREEPQWGKEQTNISFNHIFKGIDVDVRGHAGAIGIRHSGSQGSTLQDAAVYAEGAYAGLNNCCGQGGGTYNIEVQGGRYGIVIEPVSRFPLLTGCQFRGQTEACVTCSGGYQQVPTLLVGCQFAPESDCVVNLTGLRAYAGISLVDCVIALPSGGQIVRTDRREHIFIENSYVGGADLVCPESARLPSTDDWVHIQQYLSAGPAGVHLVNGVTSSDEIAEWSARVTEPAYDALAAHHYLPGPTFEDEDAVNVRSYGARGNGTADDTEAFRAAIAASDKVFVPPGHYRLTGTLELRDRTHLYGLSAALTSLGGAQNRGRGSGAKGDDDSSAFSISTPDEVDAAPGLSFLSVRGRIHWRSGNSISMLTSGFPVLSGHGGGRFYGVTAMGRPFILQGIRQPAAFYALNVERVLKNPQSEFRDCEQVRIYYFKVEAGTISRAEAGDGNTPCRITNSRDIRIYDMYGAVRKLGDRPMLEVVNSQGIQVSQLKAFEPGDFPHLTEIRGTSRSEIPSSNVCALFVRDATDNQRPQVPDTGHGPDATREN